MSDEPQKPEVQTPVEDAEDEQAVSAIYVRMTKVKSLLVEGENADATKLRVSNDAKPLFARYLDNAVKNAVKAIIAKLPRKSKGDAKGELKRITLNAEDFNE